MITTRGLGYRESRHLLLLSIDSPMKSSDLLEGIARAFRVIPKMSQRGSKRSLKKVSSSMSLVGDHVPVDYYNISIIN